jgi:hypothetical protein
VSDLSIPALIYEEDSFGVFLLVSVLLGGGAAWLAGRATASTWRPWWHVGFYMLILGLAVRFLHFALFDATLLSVHYYLIDAGICVGLGFLGFRATRAAQMATQYRWINARTGAFSWRRRTPEAAREPADCE